LDIIPVYGSTEFSSQIFIWYSFLPHVCCHECDPSRCPRQQIKAFDFVILLSVNSVFTALYLPAGGRGESNYNGLFTASLGIVNLLLAYLFLRKSKADKKFIYLLIGITLSFISWLHGTVKRALYHTFLVG
jgi:hypothetical protein